jgi:hypothetical protein
MLMDIKIVNRKTRSRALNYSLKTNQLMNGDARTEKDVKNEGRTDYVYESTGSSDKTYFGKRAFACLSARGRQRRSATFCRRNPGMPHPSRATNDASGG